jgi:hypothetical protein
MLAMHERYDPLGEANAALRQRVQARDRLELLDETLASHADEPELVSRLQRARVALLAALLDADSRVQRMGGTSWVRTRRHVRAGR